MTITHNTSTTRIEASGATEAAPDTLASNTGTYTTSPSETARVLAQSLYINGALDTTGANYFFASGKKVTLGSSGIWMDGKVFNGKPYYGSRIVFEQTGDTWGAASILTNTSKLLLNGTTLEFGKVGSGTATYLYFLSTNAENRLLGTRFIIQSDVTYPWLIFDLAATADSYIYVEGAHISLNNSGASNIPRIAGWVNQKTPSNTNVETHLRINGSSGLNNLVLTGIAPSLQANQYFVLSLLANNVVFLDDPYVDMTLVRSFDSAGTIWRRTNTKLSLSGVSDLSGISINARTANYDNAGTTDANGDYSARIVTYKKVFSGTVSWSTNNQATVTDDSAVTFRARRADLTQLESPVTASNGPLNLSRVVFADAQFTGTIAEAAAISGVNFSVSNIVVAVTVTSALTAQQIYNAWKHWTSQSAQMAGATPVSVGLITIADGVLNITGSLTTSATVSSGGNVTRGIKATGTISKTGSGAFSGLLTADSAGVQILVMQLNPNGFTLNATAFPASVMTRKVGATSWTRTSTTESSVSIAAEAGADYEVRIRVPGYVWQTQSINTGVFGLSLNASLVAETDLGGSPIFSKTTDAALMSAIAYNGANQRIEVTNTGSTALVIDFTNAFVRFQQILHTPGLVELWENQIQTNTLRNGFVIPNGNPTHVYLSSNSTAGAHLNFEVKYTDGTDARDRFHGTTAGQVTSVTTNVSLSVAVPTATENAIAVRTNLAAELGRIDAKVSDAILTTAQKQVLTDLDSMTTGTGNNAKFTAIALENAPAGGGGTGGGGLTATQAAQLARLHNIEVAHSYTLSAAVDAGATTLPIDAAFEAGYFDGHYIVINDGSGTPIQRSIVSHTKLPMPGAPGVLTLNEQIAAVPSGQEVNILIRTTVQDGPNVSGLATQEALASKPTLAQIEGSTVLAKEATVGTRASQTSVTALGNPLQAGDYVAPDNAGIADAKTAIDGLPSLSEIEGSTVLVKKSDLPAAPDNASIGEIKTLASEVKAKTDTLVNTDVSALATQATLNAVKAKTDNLPASPAATGDAMALTAAERTAVADAVQGAIIDEGDGKKVVEAIVNAVSTAGLSESAIAQAVSDKVERVGGKLDKAMKAAQAAEDQAS